jgi:hypothetical protein
MIRIRQRRDPLGAAPPAAMAPAASRFGERPTVAGVVRRRLLAAGRKAIGRSPVAHLDPESLACGHPAHQAHARFHPFPALGGRRLARG